MARQMENDFRKAICNSDVARVKVLLESDQSSSAAKYQIEHKPALHYLTGFSGRSYRQRGRSAQLDLSVRIELLELFLKHGAEVDGRDACGVTSLMVAAQSGFLGCLKVLVENGADCNLVNDAGENSLMIATENLHLDCVKYLVKKTRNLDQKDRKCGNTALILAAQSGILDCIKVLVENGADCNLTNNAGENCLILATENLYLDCAKYLLKKTRNLDQSDKKYGRTAVMSVFGRPSRSGSTVNQNQVAALKLLVQNGASINKKDQDGRTALMMAAKDGNIQCLTLLLSAKADVDEIDCNGNTALLVCHDLDCMKALIVHGACVNVRNKEGKSPLVAVVRHRKLVKLLLDAGAKTGPDEESLLLRFVDQSDDDEMVEKLLKGGASVNIQCSEGKTPLITAASRNHTRCLRVLLNAGADTEVTDLRGHTALLEAAAKNLFESLAMLIGAGADVNVTCQKGGTALMMSLEGPENGRKTHVLQKLIDSGVSVNTALEGGKTPLMCAATQHHGPEHLEMLVEAGAEVDAADSNGNTALMYALRSWHMYDRVVEKKVEILLSHGASVNVVTGDGQTPLMTSALTKNTPSSRLLLQAGADVEALDPKGYSPLMQALSYTEDWYLREVETEVLIGLLCQHGANVNISGNDGETPLSLAFALDLDDRPEGYVCTEDDCINDRSFVSSSIPALLSHGAYLDGSHKSKQFFRYYKFKDDIDYYRMMKGTVQNGCPPSFLIDQSRSCCCRPTFLVDESRGVSVPPSSLFELALCLCEPTILRYLLTTRFLTHQDIAGIFSREPASGGDSSIQLIQRNNQRTTDRGSVRKKIREMQTILDHFSQKPFTLFTLSLVKVSTVLDEDRQILQAALCNEMQSQEDQGSAPLMSEFKKLMSRKEKVKALDIPTVLKKYLLFQTPAASLPPEEWKKISLDDL